MNITIYGSGYVGLVTGACMAEVGNHVLCVDIDAEKIAALKNGEIPIHEPGLDRLVIRNFAAGRLEFTTDVDRGVAHGLFQFIAVGTPADEDGSADLQYVLAVAASIGERINEYKVGDKITIGESTLPDFQAIDPRRKASAYDDFWMLDISAAGQTGRKFFDQVVHCNWSSSSRSVYRAPPRTYVGGEPVLIPNSLRMIR